MAELRSAIFWVLCPKQSLHCYSKPNKNPRSEWRRSAPPLASWVLS
ncbi:MAG: hypothetical protein IM583_04760 [Pseudanabaena sp. M114S2SP2A07QC]|nr:hypothetical protein [Pseudanabaena sp. M172S2SP2A07QC]MCA6523461.1 hypothetical protein [Pseudanabaena sp. M051S1SP2A07QC]MCA6527074.1 hypothetical protein [Pseudanabaena sp. M179S2SP2A07QC]MCA6536523.1 hypothetical protein [Pseudanabaena sp. M176S2SP2A07QC]MCA6540508.1 hypothetical protein [Pseudanabaena sp. M037S2SP2A07QC]MCA6555942.1 hypothetical protein [Pseudanabaena sp. M114S2SP2A07QC]MCA6560016.1 hypothetical protein [Pseudanabaena sp. M079S1SP2A07QC]MCA6566105.1 hypothetical prot